MHGSGINLNQIKKHIKAADYLSVAQLFLQDNFILSRPLESKDIKPRLLGHWGTCHGINLVYANLKAYFKSDLNFVLGPGHGFPALQANLLIDGELEKVDHQATRDLQGIEYICKNFSWPGGFPSHASPVTPGVICEGGELGYALGAAYGAALGCPEKIVAVLIGDGELETATALSSLNLNKLLDDNHHGKVLPILHLNGYKISAPTIYARKSERELHEMIRGFGYEPITIDGEDPEDFQNAIRVSEKLWGSLNPPFIIMKTRKGETGPEVLNNQKIADNFLAHQIPLKNAKTNQEELRALEEWLRGYHFDTLFSVTGGFTFKPLSTITTKPKTFAKLPQPKSDDPEKIAAPGQDAYSPAKKLGELLRQDLVNIHDFYLFSPDETTSNKLDAVYQASTRLWDLPIKSQDLPSGKSGRIVELLAENTLFALMAGHVLSGKPAMMTSYESFFNIITSQLLQHIKFLKQTDEVDWRKRSKQNIFPAINLLSTSTCWRQDHNGYSHQSPALISALLNNPSNKANCLFPVDDVSMTAAHEFMLDSTNAVNLTTFNKNTLPRYIDKNHAKFQYETGASIFGFASDDNPDYIFTAAGDLVTTEALKAIEILRQDIPGRRFRFVGITALSFNAIGTTNHKMPQNIFNDYFTTDKPIIANFHGYTDTLKNILDIYTTDNRIFAHGFMEEGSTTTPFEMLSLNQASRYHLCLDVARMENRPDLVAKYQGIIEQNSEHAKTFGLDLDFLQPID